MTTTTSSRGWAWILRDRVPSFGKRTRFKAEFDGTYTAACPACGQDAPWNAFNAEPICDCGDLS